MAEKKTTKKEATGKKSATKKTVNSKTTKVNTKKAVPKKKEAKKVDTKNTTVKEDVKVDTKVAKEKKIKRESKIKRWFNNLSLEQIIIISILLIILIGVATKNTKLKNGKDIVIKASGKVITADDLYKELKSQNGRAVAINILDTYILDKEYKTTDEMKESAKATIQNYKNNYKDNYQSFLEYNGIKDDTELKNLLIKNNKLTLATEKYIKDNLTEKEMNDYYETSIVGDIEAKHILIAYEEDEKLTDEENDAKKEEAKKKAEEVIEKLKNGEDFDALAKKYSDDKSNKDNGGSLGYFNKGDMVEAFEEAAYKLEVNTYTTEPVETEYGYHVIMKTGQKDKPSYKKAKKTIIEKLVESKKEDQTMSVKAMDSLRKKYKMNIKDKTVKTDYNSYIKDAVTTTTTKASE